MFVYSTYTMTNTLLLFSFFVVVVVGKTTTTTTMKKNNHLSTKAISTWKTQFNFKTNNLILYSIWNPLKGHCLSLLSEYKQIFNVNKKTRSIFDLGYPPHSASLAICGKATATDSVRLSPTQSDPAPYSSRTTHT